MSHLISIASLLPGGYTPGEIIGYFLLTLLVLVSLFLSIIIRRRR